MVLPRWDLSASFIFDSMIKFGKDVKLDVQGVKKIFIGSRFVDDEMNMLLWYLYPPYKRPHIIDIDQTFEHLMTLKVGVTNPIDSVAMQVDVSLFNQAQTKLVGYGKR